MTVNDDEIRKLEERLLEAEVRASAAELDALISADFVEFGSSGRVYDKQATVSALAASAETTAASSIAEFHLRVLSADVVLATYRTESSLRSSIWRREGGAWRIVFHQGTPARKTERSHG